MVSCENKYNNVTRYVYIIANCTQSHASIVKYNEFMLLILFIIVKILDLF